jgi:hypothetical protein
MRFKGSDPSPPVSGSGRLGRASKTVWERTREGDPRPAGDIERDPGGERVEAYKEAADGLERRKARLVSDCDNGSDSNTGVECRDFVSFMADAAAGNAWSGSVGEAAFSIDCGMKAMASSGLR